MGGGPSEAAAYDRLHVVPSTPYFIPGGFPGIGQ